MKNLTEKRFIEEIKKRFPNVTPLMAKHEPTAYTFQMEEFANLTTCAFNNGDIAEAKEHLLFMSEKFNTANRVEREYIDTYYVEHLFWQATDSGIRTGWPLMPENLAQLYIAFHGKSPLKK